MTTPRAVRCHVKIRRTGNQCESEALDPLAELPMCAHHLAEAVREYCRLTGGKLGIVA